MSGFRPKGAGDPVDNTTIQATEVIRGIGRLFYLVDPSETAYPDLSSLPKVGYIQQAMVYFFGMVILEWIVLILKGKTPRINDGIMSVTHGFIMQFMEFGVSGATFAGYLYIYNNHRVYDLPWDSFITWLAAALGIDFCYYWVHRAAHEVNVLWAAHQVHHSAEEYNLTTALRQSAFQGLGAWPFYLPMAFFVPPQHAIIHKELNLLYQFWIHTELVKSIGPLEYILNTASHHRVHHGANRYCLDKNYAGVLIIWDRMFGTFEAEREDIEIVYGLVDQPQFFNPVRHQVFYYGKVLEKAMSMKTWSQFIFAFIKGPGWFPGTERLGDITFVAEEPKRSVYNPPVSPLLHIYTLAHFVMVFIGVDMLGKTILSLDQVTAVTAILYLLWTLTNIGLLYDASRLAWLGELARCSLSLAYLSALVPLLSAGEGSLYYFFAGSAVVSTGALVWGLITPNKNKQE